MSVLCATLLLATCGDSDSPENPIGPTPPAPQQLVQGNFTLAAPMEDSFYFARAEIANSTVGQWDATVNWTFDTNTLWMWVAEGTCTLQQFALPECPFETACPCQFVVRSETATPKPRVLSIANARSATRTLIVANLGPREESIEFRVMLTPSSLLASDRLSTPDASPAGVPHVSQGRKTAFRRE